MELMSIEYGDFDALYDGEQPEGRQSACLKVSIFVDPALLSDKGVSRQLWDALSPIFTCVRGIAPAGSGIEQETETIACLIGGIILDVQRDLCEWPGGQCFNCQAVGSEHHYELYVESGERMHRETFLRQASWLRDRAVDRHGSLVWEHSFEHPFYRMRAGWISAMAQGQCMSLLLRAYLETNDAAYLETATRAIGVFELDVESGGVMRRTENGGYFYEEYPSEPGSFVLNGNIFALWGLYEHGKLTGSDRSAKLFERGVQGLKDKLPQYDLGYWSRYDLFPANDRPAAPFYHHIHVRQLQVLADMTRDEQLRETARSWKRYERSWLCSSRAIFGIARFKYTG